MALWVRFSANDAVCFGTLADGMISQYRGDMQDGETVEVVIPEVGSLTNRFG